MVEMERNVFRVQLHLSIYFFKSKIKLYPKIDYKLKKLNWVTVIQIIIFLFDKFFLIICSRKIIKQKKFKKIRSIKYVQ